MVQRIGSADIQRKSFRRAFHGYDRSEVDVFLDEVISTLEGENDISVHDIQHKVFKRALQGYDRTEVDQFLDAVIEEFEQRQNERSNDASLSDPSYPSVAAAISTDTLASRLSDAAKRFMATVEQVGARLGTFYHETDDWIRNRATELSLPWPDLDVNGKTLPAFMVPSSTPSETVLAVIGYLHYDTGPRWRKQNAISLTFEIARHIDDDIILDFWNQGCIFFIDSEGKTALEAFSERATPAYTTLTREFCSSRVLAQALPELRELLATLRSSFYDLVKAGNEAGSDLDEYHVQLNHDAFTVVEKQGADQGKPQVNSRDPGSALQDVFLPAPLGQRLEKLSTLLIAGSAASPRGLIFHGPPGTGKTLLARAFAKSSGATFLSITTGDVKSKFGGQAGEEITRIWSDARRAQPPVVLFFDEAEGLFASRNGDQASFNERDATQSMLAEWDGVRSQNDRILVILATNSLDLLDDAILSRVDEPIELPLPTADARDAILNREFEKYAVSIPIAARYTVGFSGRDIATVARRSVQDAFPDKPNEAHVLAAIEAIRATSSTTVSEASWETVILPDELKKHLMSLARTWSNYEVLVAQGFSVQPGALLIGPPGTGKTEIARAIAHETDLMFIGVTSSDFFGAYAGQSALKVRAIFTRARAAAPAILFIDEIDTVVGSRKGAGANGARDEILGELLSQLDGIKAGPRVFVLAATNEPDMLDSAIRSRLSAEFYVPLPDLLARRAMLSIHLSKRAHDRTFDIERCIDQLAIATEALSGRDIIRRVISSIDRLAIDRAMGENRPGDVVINEVDLRTVIVALNSTPKAK